ncbi:zinc finger CCCH domain-containing protein 3 [Protopterus annectens]|uniref:zinc finger CCCH domain-containing protein 3 n=1 Tax=Protopterus annectens TaxID=7888 RepID=UPI001CFADD9C|nr:zinc finger CCCH domain-containing protein 3 [Protopterus annectens]
MEDSEALRRQIQLLEDLISRHKNTQGAVTVASAVHQRNHGQTVISRHSVPHLPPGHSVPPHRHHSQHFRNRVTWKNQYSWKNLQLGCTHTVPEYASQKLQDNDGIPRNVVQTSSSQGVTGLQKQFVQPTASSHTKATVNKETAAPSNTAVRKQVWHQSLDRESIVQSLPVSERKNTETSSLTADVKSLGQLSIHIGKKYLDKVHNDMEKRSTIHPAEAKVCSSCGHLSGIVGQKSASHSSGTVMKRSPGKVTAFSLKKNNSQQIIYLGRECNAQAHIVQEKKMPQQLSVSATVGHVGQATEVMPDGKGTEVFTSKRVLCKRKPEVASAGKSTVLNQGTLLHLKPRLLQEEGCEQSLHSLQSLSPIKLSSVNPVVSKYRTSYPFAADSSVPPASPVRSGSALVSKNSGSPYLGKSFSKPAVMAMSPSKFLDLKGQHPESSPDKSVYTWTKKPDSPVQVQMFRRHVSEEPANTKAVDCGFPLAASSSLLSCPSVFSAQTPKRKVVYSSKLPSKQSSVIPLSDRNARSLNAKYTWVAKTARCSSASRKPLSSKSLDFAKKVSSGTSKSFKSSSKYTWVAKTALSRSRSSNSVSPQALNSAKKLGVVKTSAVKLMSKCSPGMGVKKTNLTSRTGTSTSKYQWKASGVSHDALILKSMYKWKRAIPEQTGVAQLAGNVPGPGTSGRLTAQKTTSSFALTSGAISSSVYKLKSRTKLIRRRSSSNSPVDKKSNVISLMIKNRYSLWRKTPPHRRSPPVGQKTSPKGLVQLGKHKLRRLPAAKHTTEGPGIGSHQSRSPSSSKVIKTKYKIVKKNLASSPSVSPSSSKVIKTKYKIVKKNLASSPSVLSGSWLRSPFWRAWHSPSTRSVLLNRTQWPFFNRSQGLQHRWKNKGIRCIGGVMYSVSPNKLSRALYSPGTTSAFSTRRLDSAKGSPVHFVSGSCFRLSTCRYIESRAVQRSLAIIRQVKQKKEKKREYCMYYNRFGKCNRGEKCPFIHDPEKVAVCTQFLRGTCKKTDGTCIFSHKVSKDKMPVCSYFLRGICNNSNCPYSHVYVSRKADICQDFLKGYCPQGTKCKKKHTLTCQEFSKTGSCPRGSKCRLLHINRKNRKRSSRFPAAHEHSSAKRAKRGQEPQRFTNDQKSASRSEEKSSIQSENESETSVLRGLAKLPSFISLRSSSSDGVAESETEADEESKEPGRTIQIKPRF